MLGLASSEGLGITLGDVAQNKGYGLWQELEPLHVPDSRHGQPTRQQAEEWIVFEADGLDDWLDDHEIDSDSEEAEREGQENHEPRECDWHVMNVSLHEAENQDGQAGHEPESSQQPSDEA